MNEETEGELVIAKLNKDLKSIAGTMTRNQARNLVDTYYQQQKRRMREDGQLRAAEKSEEGHAILDWFAGQSNIIEKQVASVLACYAESTHMGRWAMETDGIGPIIASALEAYIDISKCETVGAIWRFAGLDPTCKWGRGKKRPHCATLKTVCWKIGESFVKVSGKDTATYGKVYQQRKAYEQAKNDAGDYDAQAAAVLKAVPDHAQAAIYKTGKLPPGHIHSRAKRYAVKLFLSHWFEEAYRNHHHKDPPLPYPIAILGHAHKV